MNASCYCFLSYKVKTARENKYRYYRGILSTNDKGKFYFKVTTAKELVFEDTLKLATLRAYRAELLPSELMAKEAMKAVLKASKTWNGGTKMRAEDIMRVSVKTQRPEELSERDKIIYERAEIGYGRVG